MGRKKKDTTTVAVRDIMAEINKEMGKGVINLASDPIVSDVISFPSGSLLLDDISGIGGWPIGRQVEIAGAYSVGKTHLAMQAMIEMQKLGGTVGFIDLEHSFDRDRAAFLGLDPDKIILATPDWLEMGLDIVEKIIPVTQLIVFDSVGGSSTRKEFEGQAEDEDMGVRAKRLTRTVPKIGTLCDEHNCTIIWINQKRDSLEKYKKAAHNSTPGGNNFKHQMSMRLFLTTGEPLKRKDERIGHLIMAKMVKNKLSAPFKETGIPFLYQYGVCNEWELIVKGVDAGVLTKSGAYCKHGNVTLGQGDFNTVLFLKHNPELYEQIQNEVSQSLSIQE